MTAKREQIDEQPKIIKLFILIMQEIYYLPDAKISFIKTQLPDK